MPKTHDKTKQITKALLMGLGVTAAVAGIIIFPGLAHLLKWIDDTGFHDRRKSRQAFYSLKKRGMIRTRGHGNKIKIVLTEKAKQRIQRYNLHNLKVSKPKNWDGRWWLVMFDIPERRHVTRDLVRRKLRSEGFVAIQKSVLVYPFACQELILNLRDYFKLSPGELYVFEAQVLEGEKQLQQHFKL